MLEKNGFERIGLARAYLRIAGEWRDHILFQRVARMSVTLRPMRADEYPAWAEQGERGYVYRWSVRRHGARRTRRRRPYATLPGCCRRVSRRKGHWLYVIEADGQAVGSLWFAERDLDGGPTAYLYDIQIDEHARGRGYGRAAMLEFEREAARRRACITCR